MKQDFIDSIDRHDTPFYYYDLDVLHNTLHAIAATQPVDSIVHYALKANSDLRLLSIIAQRGLGADCVSGGEIQRAISAGVHPQHIVYSGVGKTDREIEYALSCNIDCFNVESLAELQVIDSLAAACGKIAPVAFRINPHIDAHTHHYITTGTSETKFGIDISQLDQAIECAVALSHVRLRGLHFHIGSQILSFEPYCMLCSTVNCLQEQLAERGIDIDYINVGGGLGIDYDSPDENTIPPFAQYFDIFKKQLQLQPGVKLHFELGRSIVGQCGSLISRVLYVKEGVDRDFVILDAGMTELIRPALYQASHLIENHTSQAEVQPYDIVGPVCETSDTFGSHIMLPTTRRGDIIAIRSAGAYAQSMAMTYNSRPLAPAVYSE